MSEQLSPVLKPPYYAVIFTSLKRQGMDDYADMAEKMAKLASEQKGFLGMDSARNAEGLGITTCYWETEEDILNWKQNEEHLLAQESGKTKWYEHYSLRVCQVKEHMPFKSFSAKN